MKRFVLRAKTGRSLAGLAVAAAALAPFAVGAQQGNNESKPAIPMIVMEDVPLLDAIKNLARQAGINYIIAPDVIASLQPGPDGSPAQRRTVTVRWENLTAAKALEKMLAEGKLVLVTNAESSIARVSKSNETRKPTGIDQASGSTNVIPLIVMDEVLLADALKNLARLSQLDLTLDPRLSDSGSDNGISRQTISIRWEGVSTRQALAALLDNYDLVLTGITNSTAQITPRLFADAKADRPGQPNADK
jgi:hypothetical protein